MIDILVDEVRIRLDNHFRSKGFNPALYKCTVSDVSLHDKNTEGGNEEEVIESIILSLVSIEEEHALKNNYPTRESGAVFIREKSAVYVNAYLLFSAKYGTYDTALKAISQVISCFQAARRLVLPGSDGSEQEVVLSLHNLGFENLNNLWTVLGGRYLPSVIYKARLLMYQQSPPISGSLITDIREQETIR